MHCCAGVNVVAGILFALHAAAHLVGFAGAFGLAAGAPLQTTAFFGRVHLGESGARAAGVGWLFAASGFAIAAAGAFADAPWWPRFVVMAATASLAMCLLYLPRTRVGVALNLALLVVFLLGRAAFWWMLRG